MKVYLNYPNPHISIHRDPSCSEVQKNRKEGQRVLHVSRANWDQTVADFGRKKYRFASIREFNDMWLEVSMDSEGEVLRLVKEVHAALGGHYRPFARAEVIVHC